MPAAPTSRCRCPLLRVPSVMRVRAVRAVRAVCSPEPSESAWGGHGRASWLI
jgi:hypothetical protein